MTIIFFAGCEGEEFSNIAEEVNGNCLISYFHMPPKLKKVGTIKAMRSGVKRLFIDSGAFSAWSLKKHIDIDNYIEFCKKTDADYYAVLDEIGNAEKTLQNQKYMESKGTNPVPCFHYGEDWKYIEYYCNNYDFIAIGGLVGRGGKIEIWLDTLFSKYPNKKFHGFGLTTKRLVIKYPWYSVDSSSWLMGGRSGTLFSFKNGNLYYKELKKNTYKSNLFLQEIEEMELTKEEILISHIARNKFNAYQYGKIENAKNYNILKNKQFQLDKYMKTNYQPISKYTLLQMHTKWIKDQYGDIPEDLAIKLINHNKGGIYDSDI